MKNNKSSPKQLVLFKNTQKRFFGGALLYKKRKSKRPISTREPLHLVFRSSFACGLNSFINPRNKSKINLIIKRTADKYGVRIYQTALMSNHLHLIVLFPNRFSYHAFVSVLSGLIARHVMRKLSYKQFVKHAGGGGQGGPNSDGKDSVISDWQTSSLGQEGHGGDALVCFNIPVQQALNKVDTANSNSGNANIGTGSGAATNPTPSIGITDPVGVKPCSSCVSTVWRMTEQGRRSIVSAKPLEQYLAEKIQSKKIILDQLNQMSAEEGYKKLLTPFIKLPAPMNRISEIHRKLGWLSEDGISNEYGLLDINDSGFIDENEFDKTHCKELQAVVRRDNQLWYDADIVGHFDTAGKILIQLHEEIYAWGKQQDEINTQAYGFTTHETSAKTRRLILKIIDTDTDEKLMNSYLKDLGFSTLYWDNTFKVPTPIGSFMDYETCLNEQKFLANYVKNTSSHDFWFNTKNLFADRYLNSSSFQTTLQLRFNFPDDLSNLIGLTMISGGSNTFESEFTQLLDKFEKPEACVGHF